MTETINALALGAKSNVEKRERLIRSQKQTILRTASAACRRYVSPSDDEWSVALCAFSKAIDVYDEEKGEFLPFAQMLIRRELIDHFRTEKAAFYEFPVAPHILEGNGEPEEDSEGVYLAVIQSSREKSDHSLREEILSVNELLQSYGFRFFDLTECSPQREKTRLDCAAAIRCMRQDASLHTMMEKSRKLPIKALAKASGISRKTLDRYRKYIIMAVVVLGGDYPILTEYLKFVKEA